MAKQYKEHYDAYCGTAKFWTETYAVAKDDQAGEAIAFLVSAAPIPFATVPARTVPLRSDIMACCCACQLEMGFDEAKSREYLEKHDYDRNKALEALLAAS